MFLKKLKNFLENYKENRNLMLPNFSFEFFVVIFFWFEQNINPNRFKASVKIQILEDFLKI